MDHPNKSHKQYLCSQLRFDPEWWVDRIKELQTGRIHNTLRQLSRFRFLKQCLFQVIRRHSVCLTNSRLQDYFVNTTVTNAVQPLLIWLQQNLTLKPLSVKLLHRPH